MFMNSCIEFLARRKWLTIPLILAYLYLVATDHLKVQSLLRTWQYDLPAGLVGAAIGWGTIATLGLFSILMFRKRDEWNRLLLGFWVCALCTAGAAYWLLVFAKSELVHFPQYALLTVPVF